MLCYHNQLCCQILRDAYYYYNNPESSRINLSDDKHTFCVKCFDSIKSKSIFVDDDPVQTLVEISKNLFLSDINDIQKAETMIECIIDIMRDCLDNQVQTALYILYFEELDQEEEDRRKQRVEVAQALEDRGLDDPIEPEHETVTKLKF
ncbi:unnamed protein product [Rotaria sp. Silwood2]|nr:unnamed protein product [Rotaria sp. Silwood2]